MTDGAVERIIPITIEAIDKETNSKIILERETANKICEKDGHYYLKVSLLVNFHEFGDGASKLKTTTFSITP